MSNMTFCPHCTAEWDRPWYDICPSCGHRFIDRPWWHSPTLIVGLICLPAAILVALGLVAGSLPVVGSWDLETIAVGITLFGPPLGSLAAAVLLSLRMGRKGGALFGWILLWVLVFGCVSFILCFFSCLFAFGQ